MGSAEEFGGLSIVIPTYNERANAEPLLGRFVRVRDQLPRDLEILVVDDDSPDGTAGAFRDLGLREQLPVRVILRKGRRNLGTAIVEGLRQSRGELVCVMDADLSHPPEDIPRMLDALDGADGVVASRYAPGGRIASWPHYRRLVSFLATAFATDLIRTDCTDPVSGFFLFRRSSLTELPLSGRGNKPLVEILAGRSLTLHEVAYEFRDREHGRSKLGIEGIAGFASLVLLLGVRAIRNTSRGTAGERVAANRAREL